LAFASAFRHAATASEVLPSGPSCSNSCRPLVEINCSRAPRLPLRIPRRAWCSFSECGSTCLWFWYGLSLGRSCRLILVSRVPAVVQRRSYPPSSGPSSAAAAARP
jgi:hypothetical protein